MCSPNLSFVSSAPQYADRSLAYGPKLGHFRNHAKVNEKELTFLRFVADLSISQAFKAFPHNCAFKLSRKGSEDELGICGMRLNGAFALLRAV